MTAITGLKARDLLAKRKKIMETMIRLGIEEGNWRSFTNIAEDPEVLGALATITRAYYYGYPSLRSTPAIRPFREQLYLMQTAPLDTPTEDFMSFMKYPTPEGTVFPEPGKMLFLPGGVMKILPNAPVINVGLDPWKNRKSISSFAAGYVKAVQPPRTVAYKNAKLAEELARDAGELPEDADGAEGDTYGGNVPEAPPAAAVAELISQIPTTAEGFQRWKESLKRVKPPLENPDIPMPEAFENVPVSEVVRPAAKTTAPTPVATPAPVAPPTRPTATIDPKVTPETPTEALAVTGRLLPPGTPIDRDLYLEPNELQRRGVKSIRAILDGIATARHAAHGTASSAALLLASYQPVIQQLRESIADNVKHSGYNVTDTKGVLKDITELNSIVSASADAMRKLVEAEKLALGAPTSIIGLIQAPPAAKVEVDSAAEAARTLQALMSLGGIPKPEAAYKPETNSREFGTDGSYIRVRDRPVAVEDADSDDGDGDGNDAEDTDVFEDAGG